MKREEFVPIPYNPVTNTYRVPMWIDGDEYSINVGRYETRYYTSDTLPSEIKVSLAMIHAFPFTFNHDEWVVKDLGVYVNLQDPKLNDIGWRVTPEMYVIVMPTELLYGMRISK